MFIEIFNRCVEGFYIFLLILEENIGDGESSAEGKVGLIPVEKNDRLMLPEERLGQEGTPKPS